MKCEITGKDIERTFLNKILGTVIRDTSGKKHFVSSAAQAQFKNDKSQILSQISKK